MTRGTWREARTQTRADMRAMGYPDHAPWLRRWRAEAHAGPRGLAETPVEWFVHRHRSQWFDQTRACRRAGSVASGAKGRQPDSPLRAYRCNRGRDLVPRDACQAPWFTFRTGP